KTEEFSREEMIKLFSIERVNKAPASFDPEKLMAFEARAMQRVPVKQRVAKAVGFMQRAGWVADPPPCDTGPYVTRIVEAAGERIKVGGDVLDYDEFFTADEALQIDEAAFEKRLVKDLRAATLLKKFREVLAKVEPFDVSGTEKALHDFVAAEGIKASDIVHA